MNDNGTQPLTTTSQRLAGYFERLRRNDFGWVGVDVGTAGMKLVQLERAREGYRFVARWRVGLDEVLGDDGSAHELPARYATELRSTRRLFRGNDAAAAVSTSLSELRLLTLPITDGDELRAMAAEELAADCENEAELRTAIWAVDRAPRPDSSIRVLACGMAGDVADKIGCGLRSSGFAPRVLDVAPCAMARAVLMTNSANPSVPTAAIDLGYSTALLTISIEGKPTFCRKLRDCGLRAILDPMAQQLGVSPTECRRITMRSGAPDEFDISDHRQKFAHSLLSPGLDRLADELNRTLTFVRQELPLHRPERMCLFGGGALIKNVAGFLTRRCGLPTAPWSLESFEARDPTEPLFGIAAGLSSIAWEN